MTTPAIHQFVATAEPGAIGAHILQVQRLIRDVLHRPSEIFAEHLRGPFVQQGRPYQDYGDAVAADADDLVVYHLAIGSNVADWLVRRPQDLVVVHHNLTPVRFLRGWDPDATYGVEWGLRQLPELGARAVLGIGDSSFNQADLITAGFHRTVVAPVLVDLSPWVSRENARAAGGPALVPPRRGTSWLFVGRMAAHKCQHQIVRALAAYRRVYDPEARLTLIGGPTTGSYVAAVRSYADALDLGDAVTLAGSVSDDELADAYASSDVFVCLSEHEGFCVPLLEAMATKVPVVALGATAVPETVGDAALVLPFRGDRQPSALHVAAAVHRVVTDGGLRDVLVGAGLRRAGELSLAVSGRRYLDVLGDVAGGASAP